MSHRVPWFDETLDEKFVTRARIVLAEAFLEGSLKDRRGLGELWKTCIKCSRCTAVCPSGVKGDEISMGIAALLNSSRPDTQLKKFFSAIVPDRKLFDAFIMSAYLGQQALPKRRRGLLRHLPLAVMGKRDLPRVASRSALNALPRRSGPDKPRLSAALFIGCAINYAYPHTAHSMVKLLTALGVEVVVPKNQLCCGTPALTMGLVKEAAELAKKNIKVLSSTGCDVVVTGCASCALTLGRNYADLLPDESMPRVVEFSKLLHELGYEPREQNARKVSYHDPCHLRFGLGIKDEPREILDKAAVLTDMPNEEKCCGGGGSFSFFNPELADELGARKVEGACGTEADTVVTTCPGCVMQLREQFEKNSLETKVMHLADFLTELQCVY
ncbi:MAG: (Fe-S)-binding protein [Planctomycetota bacterium]|nr:(Fe-S)-binding protein [Planctomycetota bacterium]